MNLGNTESGIKRAFALYFPHIFLMREYKSMKRKKQVLLKTYFKWYKVLLYCSFLKYAKRIFFLELYERISTDLRLRIAKKCAIIIFHRRLYLLFPVNTQIGLNRCIYIRLFSKHFYFIKDVSRKNSLSRN